MKSNTTTKKSYTINKKFSVKAKLNSYCKSVLQKFSTGSEHFDKYYIYGKTLYHETAGAVYEFANDKIRKIESYPEKTWSNLVVNKDGTFIDPYTRHNVFEDFPQYLQLDFSYYMLWDNFLIEITLHDANPPANIGAHRNPNNQNKPFTPKYKVTITKTEFSKTDGTVIDKTEETINFEYNVCPYILLIDSYVIITKVCTFGTGQSGWHVQMQRESNSNGDVYRDNELSIIYRLNQQDYYTIAGTIDLNILQLRYTIAFTGRTFQVIDLRTGVSKLDIVSGLVTQTHTNSTTNSTYQSATIKKLIIPFRIPESQLEHTKRARPVGVNKYNNMAILSANAFQVISHVKDDMYDISVYELNESDIYNPEPNECIVCYCEISRKYVLTACGHNQYCKTCIKKLVNSKGQCPKCKVDATGFVKVQE